MIPDQVKRKLAAILSADVQGYSRLMGEDEEGTIRTLKVYLEVISKFIAQLPEKAAQPAPPPAPKIEVASKDKLAFPLPDKPSIAVLPFTNMSSEKELEYFCDGLVEGIINGLSKFDNIFVIARNSTFIYKGKPVKVKQVAEEMGVRCVIEGSVQSPNLRHRSLDGPPGGGW